ncbi:hypothetical protein KFL_000710110 [Klebsormidium nitens]|uniref:Uncharacterized protein n=1 Tax=Klebsormidium nitens TaxID=105231 RepID=A0A1Y1HX63_KLENI|nr:hypothetical protein KFL_000710110 [Klebsormidium nitens]|eukprot:GAQ81106.1 hypothetical protein KFL_000710110 [Klebsormidium nitens]
MSLFRVRLASFAAGFAVAGGLAIYQLQKDLWASHKVLSEQAANYQATVEKRLAKLEAGSKSPPSALSEGLAELRFSGSSLGSVQPQEIKQEQEASQTFSTD